MKMNRFFTIIVAFSLVIICCGCSSADTQWSDGEWWYEEEGDHSNYSLTLQGDGMYVLRIPINDLQGFYGEDEMETLRLVGPWTKNWSYEDSEVISRIDRGYVYFHDIPARVVERGTQCLVTSHFKSVWYKPFEGRKSEEAHDNDRFPR